MLRPRIKFLSCSTRYRKNEIVQGRHNKVANSLSKMSLGKFTPSLGISDFWKYDGLGVSEYEHISDFIAAFASPKNSSSERFKKPA